MAKSPKNDKSSGDEETVESPVAQDAIEDAVVIDETPAGDDKAETPGGETSDKPGPDKTDKEAPDDAPSPDTAPDTAAPWGATDAGTTPEDTHGDTSGETSDATTEGEGFVMLDGEEAPEQTAAEAQETEAQEVEAQEVEAQREDAGASGELPVVAPTAPPARRGGLGAFFGFVIGGVVAGAIGFGAAQYVSGGWPFAAATPEEDPLAAALDAQGNDLAALREQVETNAATLAEVQGDTSLDDLGGQLRADIVATQTRIEELSTRLNGLDDRVSALEKMPSGDGAAAAEAAAAAYERELSEMREMLDREIAALKAQQADAETLQQNAAKAAQAASARAAMSRIMAALDSGQPFDDALFDLTNSTGMQAPEGLASVADEGVVTLATLQAEFPAAAREALDESLRAMVESGELGRGEAFLRTQLGTRSLEPQEGDDPDAILSRAEFALKNGRIAEALEELATMPEAAQPALAEWIAKAETRLAALDAGSELAQQVNE